MTETAGPTDDGPLANISRGIVGLLKEHYGKGPERAKTYIQDDLVVVLMRGGFTRVEETLMHAGRGDDVLQQRLTFHHLMRGAFSQIIEQETGRKVIAFMSGSHQHPDVIAELFILAPSDLAG